MLGEGLAGRFLAIFEAAAACGAELFATGFVATLFLAIAPDRFRMGLL